MVKDVPPVMQVFQENIELSHKLDAAFCSSSSAAASGADQTRDKPRVIAMLRELNEKIQVLAAHLRTASCSAKSSKPSSSVSVFGDLCL